jgi:undecaprenyl-diphosphatase
MSPVLAYVNAEDFRIHDRVLAFRPPRCVRLWVLWATRLGDGWLQVATGVALFAAGSECQRTLAACVMATGLSNLAMVILKRRFRRKRPCEYAAHPLFDVKPLGYLPSDDFSFPSGHSMNAFAVGTVVALQFPWLAPLGFLLATSVAASRVLLGLHFVSDVVVGAGIGASLGLSVFLALIG